MKNLEALGEHVAARLDASALADHADDRLRAKLAERAGSRKPRAAWTKPRFVVPALGVAAVAVAATFLVVPSETRPPLTFTVGSPGRPGVLGESVSAPAESGTSLRFSEGSRIGLDPMARATVERATPAGAELVLEAGRARVDVVPRPDNAWRVQTGPFSVLVTGTRFDLDWDPTNDHFSLALYEGKVTVSGCSFGSGRKLVAGERAEASCKTGTESVSPLSTTARSDRETSVAPARPHPIPSAAPNAFPTATASEADATPTLQKAPRGAERPGAAPSEPWTPLARSGRYAEAYALAALAGIAGECENRSADDVLLLGETARLTDHVGDARLAYQAVRRRFAGSPAAAQAAFNLGRLDVRAGNRQASAAWFEAYLREQPSGPLAQAALGRLLEARAELGDTRAARDTARSYLERYPTGPHADAARKILESESKR
jgi:ferric-dicitrate binding protein FerR (iron transport regulator)